MFSTRLLVGYINDEVFSLKAFVNMKIHRDTIIIRTIVIKIIIVIKESERDLVEILIFNTWVTFYPWGTLLRNWSMGWLFLELMSWGSSRMVDSGSCWATLSMTDNLWASCLNTLLGENEGKPTFKSCGFRAQKKHWEHNLRC